MCRKLIFLTSFLLVLGLVFANVTSGYTISVNITEENNDVEERLDRDNALDLGSSDVEMPYEDTGMGDPQVIGLRYPGLTLPKGSTIISAYLQFQIDENKGGTEPVNLVIEGDLAADAATFGAAFSVTERTRTAAKVLWSVPDWVNVGDRGPDQATPDLTAIIQEIVDQDGWASGNALALIISDDPDNPSSGIRCAEAGPGDDSATLIIEFTTPISWGPIPADKAIEVDTTTLEWSPGSDALFHRVYITTDPTFEDPNLLYSVETDVPLIALALDPGTTYYWVVVDVVDVVEDPNDPNDIEVENPGDIWSFTTLALEAHFPSPYNGGKWIPLDAQLSWTAGKDAIMHDVYFDVNEALVAAADPNTYMGKLMDTSFDPGALEPGTTYYWKVDEFAIGVTNPGTVWSFTATEPDVGGVETEFYLGRTLAGKPVVIRTDKNIDFNWGEAAPDPNVPVDNFSVRFNADLQVAVDGIYKLHGSADDGIRVWLNGANIIDAWVDQGVTEYDSPPLDLVAGQKYLVTLEQYENGGGAAAELRWSSDVISKQIIPSGALMPPTVATSPVPADGAANVSSSTILSWNPGEGAVQFDMILGTAEEVAAGDLEAIYKGRLDEPTYDPGILDLNTTYYWIVNCVDANGVETEGFVWAFTVSENVIVDDIETYNDIDNLVSDAWIAAGGAIVGNDEAPYINWENVNSGLQAMPLVYDNSADPFASEVTLTLDPAQYWGSGVGGAVALDISFRGRQPEQNAGSTTVDPETGIITMVGRGADIWGTADQFQYAFLSLSGDGSMTIKVEDVAETDNWTKIGVQVRETLDAGSKHASVYVTTPVNGVRFQKRAETDASSESDSSVATDEQKAQIEPVWLRLERIGDEFNAYYAAPLPEPVPVDPNDPNAVPVDPNAPEPELEWIPMVWNPQVIPMDPNVFIGLALTSHSGAETYATATISSIETDGGVGDLPFTSQEIGLTTTQSPATLYVALEDSAGGISVVKHPDPDAVLNDEWANWTIYLSDFDIDMADVAKLTIGVEPAAGDGFVYPVYTGMGRLDIDDIQLIADVDMYEGTLDGWDHDNSVDMWDGSAPGEGNPGGVASITEDDVTYLRVQDAGDPRDYGTFLPKTQQNFSIYLTQPTDFALDGAIIEFRARLATAGPLDAWYKGGEKLYQAGPLDWPSGGIGGSFDWYGRGNIGIAEKGQGLISFALSSSGLMVGNSGNKISVDDATQWNTYKIEISAGGSGTHILKASANGGDVKTFNVTAVSVVAESGTNIEIGAPDLSGNAATAFDVDYIKVSWK